MYAYGPGKICHCTATLKSTPLYSYTTPLHIKHLSLLPHLIHHPYPRPHKNFDRTPSGVSAYKHIKTRVLIFTVRRHTRLKITKVAMDSDMRIDGPIFVPKSGYFLLIRFKACLKKLVFLTFKANFTSWLFLQNVGSFKQGIHLCPCFWLFSLLYFYSLVQILFARLL